ncbi:MAG: hypothetical protein NZP72_11320 [Geminicoccaceae bacterium]|nr:hypothetical protein [Geminicoccaceae bacterium]
MKTVRRALLPLLAACGGACVGIAPSPAGVLLEARLEGIDLRLEFALPGEPAKPYVLATLQGRSFVLDPETGIVRDRLEGGEAPPRRVEPAADRLDGVRLSAPGGGAMVAGQLGLYHLLFHEGRICGELLVSPWMAEPLRPAVRALTLLERIEPRLRPRERHGCPPLPFASWAQKGWPLLMSGREVTIFRTERIRFDHPLPPLLAGEAIPSR